MKFDKLVAKILNESVNMDEIIRNVKKAMKYGEEPPVEFLINLDPKDFGGVSNEDIVREMWRRGELDANLQDDLEENFPGINLPPHPDGNGVLHEFSFGYDTKNIKKVQDYVIWNYSPEDYEMHTGIGDDHMNFLEIKLTKRDRKEDSKFMRLIQACEGGGEVRDEEDFEDDYDEY